MFHVGAVGACIIVAWCDRIWFKVHKERNHFVTGHVNIYVAGQEAVCGFLLCVREHSLASLWTELEKWGSSRLKGNIKKLTLSQTIYTSGRC